MFVSKLKTGSCKRSADKQRCGNGLLNSVINNLPFELHIPGYRFCGPGTKLKKRLARGDVGVNKLDEACREHDIAYSKNQDLENRHKADNILLEKAKQRLHSSDARFGEKASAFAVSTIMKTKVKLGMGCKSRRQRKKQKKVKRLKHGKGLRFTDLTRKAKAVLKKGKFINTNDAITATVKAIKAFKGKKKNEAGTCYSYTKNWRFSTINSYICCIRSSR